MSLEVVDYNNINKREWSDFVINHSWGTIFQTPEMYMVYEHTSHNTPLVVGVCKDGKLVGVLLAVIITNGNKFLTPITARSIIIGGPLVEDNNPDIINFLFKEYKKVLPWYVVYSEIRPIYNIDLLAETLKDNKFIRDGHYNIFLNVTKSKDDLWQQMHKERKRNVNQAEKAGLVFKEVIEEDEINQIINLINLTYQRKRVPMSYEDIFVQAKEYLQDSVKYFAAYYEDKMVAGQVRLCYKDLVYAWFAGSDSDYFKLRPNDFIMWNVIVWSHINGYKIFDFGGGGKPGVPYGVRDYKMKYGCEIEDFGRYIYKHRPITYKLGEMAIKLIKKDK